MVPKAVALCGIVVILAGVAHAQAEPGSQSPAQPPVSSTDAAPLPADAPDATTPPAADRLRRFGPGRYPQMLFAPEIKPFWSTQFDVGARQFSGEPAHDAMPQPTNPNAPWKVSGGFSYSSRNGSVTSIGLLGHRNYRMPLFLSQTIGGDDRTLPLASFTDLSQREIQWALTARVGKTLKRTSSGRTISAVADLLVPLNEVSPSPGPADLVIPSRAVRFGLVFGF
jgi:hypothetical protein